MSQFSSPTIPTVEDLEIHYDYDDNHEKQYYLPGDLMRGTAMLHLRSHLQVNKILMYVTGEATVSWEFPGRKKTYSAHEEYLNVTKLMMDAGYDRFFTLGPGTHEFRFAHQLPENIPSTFRGVYGSVKYVLKVEVFTEANVANFVVSEPFMVLRRPPLPKETYRPKEMKQSRRFLSGQVKLNAGLTRWGGVPGENLYVNAQVVNWSSRDIKKINATIIMTSVFYAKKKKIQFRQIIGRRDDEYLFNQRHGRRWRAVKLKVPPYIPESGLNCCGIMDVTYQFMFKVQLENSDLDVDIPIKIGGHPIGYGPESEAASLARFSVSKDFPYFNGALSNTDTFSDYFGDLR